MGCCIVVAPRPSALSSETLTYSVYAARACGAKKALVSCHERCRSAARDPRNTLWRLRH